MKQPTRGFDQSEFEVRTSRVQSMMAEQKIDALFLTTEPNVRYFTGFLTQFWQSPTRPWFLVVPAQGKPIAIIPEIGAAGMAGTWVDDIRTWASPQPEDDGISIVAGVLKEHSKKYGRIGVTLGHESHLRMPAGDYQKLKDQLPGVEVADSTMMLRDIRFVKSAPEIEKIEYACHMTSDAFIALPEKLSIGMTEVEACRELKLDILGRGLDSSPYLISGSGQSGYDSIIMGPTDKVIEDGDVLIIDTGSTFDGYHCDFDRNWAFGNVDDAVKRAHEIVHQSTDAGFATARPGATMADVFHAMWNVLEDGGALGNDVGRMGHGLGIQLTEGPSIMPADHTVLAPGAVITLEPGMEFAPGRQMVHEENIVITEDGARWLSKRGSRELPQIA